MFCCSLVVQRLWFKTNLKLCKIWFDIGEYGRMIKVTFFFFLYFLKKNECFIFCCMFHDQSNSFSPQILKELHKSCQREDGTDDQKKGSQLLEVYAIEIQMYTETKNNKKLKVMIVQQSCAFHYEVHDIVYYYVS